MKDIKLCILGEPSDDMFINIVNVIIGVDFISASKMGKTPRMITNMSRVTRTFIK